MHIRLRAAALALCLIAAACSPGATPLAVPTALP
jgi:hypothetical protein